MKILAKVIIIIFIFSAGFLFGQKYTPENTLVDDTLCSSEEISFADLKLDFGNGEIKNFEAIKINEVSTVFSILKNISEEENIDLDYKDYGEEMGVMINSVGGIKNNFDAGNYWQYWINGDYAKVGASAQLVNDGDTIEWKYTEGQF